MSVIERIKELQLPSGQYVVIGSGLLDAYGLREANDIDLVVLPNLFDQLRASGLYTECHKGQEVYLTEKNIEIWLDWGAEFTCEHLLTSAVVIEGIAFVNPDILIHKKRSRGTVKDLDDILLLKEHIS
jgi:hypothetical protein